MADLKAETERLLAASMAENTRHTYEAAADSFNYFRYTFNLQPTWPAPLDHIVKFIAYMSTKNLAPASIRTYISGLYQVYLTCTKSKVLRMLPGLL